MSDTDLQATELIERMKRGRGYMHPGWVFAAKKVPGFLEAYRRLADYALLHEPETAAAATLPAKYREFVAIGILAFRGRERGVREHIRRARRLGATEEELLEVAQTAVIPGGSPSMMMILETLCDVLEEETGGQASQ